jgi:glutamate racemase
MADRSTADAPPVFCFRGSVFRVKYPKIKMILKSSNASIGIFDSGLGGLSVLQAIRSELPEVGVIYVADQAHVPYGSRPMAQVLEFSMGITHFLLAKGAKIIVVACNTASAAALKELRQGFPTIPFVGMEPALKPAAEHTKSGVVGVLATPATFQGELYASVVERFANGVIVLQHTCPGLVGQIERGELDSPKTRSILEDALIPMLEKGIDTVVLGCTHYPFVIPLIEQICGNQVRVIDPAPAVARQTRRVLEANDLLSAVKDRSEMQFYTSGSVNQFLSILPELMGGKKDAGQVLWNGQDLN